MDTLAAWIEEESTRQTPAEVIALFNSFCNTLPNKDGIRGGLFYGSALWKTPDPDSIWDLYVLVDRYRDSTSHAMIQLMGICLPPNVYYHETKADDGTVIRGKIALMRLAQFESHCKGAALSPQIWARFSQPCRIIATRDDISKQRIIRALRNAVITFHKKTAPWILSPCTIEEFWLKGLNRTYASEFRAERKHRQNLMIESSRTSFIVRSKNAFATKELHALILEGEYIHTRFSPTRRRFFRNVSRVACYISKAQHLLRLMKAAFTFTGGIDYLAYKIERHSAVKLTPTAFQRNHPLIGVWGLFFKGLKHRAFR